MRHNSVVSSYSKSTRIPRVDGLSTDPRVLGRYNFSYICIYFIFNYFSY